MANMDKDNINNIWPYNISINGAGSIQHTFATQNKFIDANIVATITTPARGTLSLDLDNNTDTVLTVGTLNNNKYPFTANMTGTITAATAGWITNSAESVSENSVTVGYLNKAGFTISTNGNEFVCNSPGYVESGNTVLASINSVTPTASIDTGTNSNYNGLTTYFTKLNNSTGANVTIKPQYTTTSAGYVSQVSNAVTTANITYWQIKTTSPTFSAAPTGGSTAEFSNITTSDTNNGIKIQTKYTISSVAIKYGATSAGWLTEKTNGANTGSSTTAVGSTSGTSYYITGITVPTGKNFSLTTATNNSTDSSTITITNNNNRKLSITNSGNVYISQTTSGKGDVYVTPYNGSQIQIIDDGAMMTTSATPSTWSKNASTNVATMGNLSWGDGYISSGSLDAAIFTSSAESGVTYLNLDDALTSAGGTFVVPELAANGRLYIKRGYIDNISISLGHLIADASAVTGLAAGHIRVNHSAYDNNGNLIVGTIPDLAAATYHPSLSDQTIAAGKYIAGTQTFKAVTTNLEATKIAYGQTIKIGDASDDDCVTSVAGSFTQSGTQSSGQIVAAAGQILPGYSAWVNGAEVKGSMTVAAITLDKCAFDGSGNSDLDNYLTATNTSSGDVSITPQYTNTAGYIEAHGNYQNGTKIYYNLKAPKFTSNGGSSSLTADTTNTSTARSIYTGSTDTFISINSSAPALDTTHKVYIKISSQDSLITTSSGYGAIKASTIAKDSSGNTAYGTHTSYIGIDLYEGEYSTAAVTT